MPHAIALTTFPAPCRWTSHGSFRELGGAEIIEMFDKAELWPASTSVRESAGLLPGWSFARFADDARVTGRDEAMAALESARRVVEVHGLMLDYLDEPAVDEAHLATWWDGLWFVAHTTAFHEVPQGERPTGPRWRVLLPLTRPVSAEVARDLVAWARHPRRGSGMIAAESAEAGRVVPLPAIGPGGYRHTRGGGRRLDPDAALAELAVWQAEDVERAAREDLAGCLLDEAVAGFLAARQGGGPAAFDWSGVHAEPSPGAGELAPGSAALTLSALAPLGPLWPGRLAVLVGGSGSGRTALALQVAAAVARSGSPVLYVSLDTGTDELVARLVALRAKGGVAHRDVLLARWPEAELEAACRQVLEDFRGLHLWAPAHAERSGDALVKRVESLRRAAHGRPPLVVLDSVEDWEGSSEVAALGELFGALRDVARPGCLGPDWPGAGVLAVAGVGPALAPAFASRAKLEHALAEEGPLEVGPTREAALVLALATERVGAADRWRSALVAAKNRHGLPLSVELAFDARRGRFEDED